MSAEGRAVAGEPAFAHSSERRFSEILNFYGVAWQYEPTTFVLERDDSGRVTEAFTPDFYLPGYDVYVELTTLKQKLVTRKNRKVRKLRTCYPDVCLRILHRRATLGLLAKYSTEPATAGAGLPAT